jgi:hypothetical protein
MAALGQLPPPAQVLLQCCYTAATYLRRKYTSALQAAQLLLQPLPPLFVETPNLPTLATAEASIVQLALGQTELSGSITFICGLSTHARCAQLWPVRRLGLFGSTRRSHATSFAIPQAKTNRTTRSCTIGQLVCNVSSTLIATSM